MRLILLTQSQWAGAFQVLPRWDAVRANWTAAAFELYRFAKGVITPWHWVLQGGVG